MEGDTRDIAAALIQLGAALDCGCCSPAFRGENFRMDLSMDNARVITTAQPVRRWIK